MGLHSPWLKDERENAARGFTLVEVLAVLVLLGLLAIFALPRYASLEAQSRLQAARGLVASAQSQLLLEYARRVLNSENFGVAAQAVCNQVSLSSNAGMNVVLQCTGNLNDAAVIVNATVGDQTATANWSCPQAGT